MHASFERTETNGLGRVALARVEGRTVATSCRATSPLRLLVGRPGDVTRIATSTLGGGLVDRDSIDLEVEVGREARAVLTTQASTKVYRSRHGSASALRATVREGALLVSIPDPVVPFANARYTQTTSVHLAEDASVVLVDVLTCGRAARGERWAFARVRTDFTITGSHSLRDALLLDATHGSIAARMHRFDAIGTIVLAGPATSRARAREAMRIASSPARGDRVVEAASVRGETLVVRLAASDVESMQRRVRAIVEGVLDHDPFARKH